MPGQDTSEKTARPKGKGIWSHTLRVPKQTHHFPWARGISECRCPHLQKGDSLPPRRTILSLAGAGEKRFASGRSGKSRFPARPSPRRSSGQRSHNCRGRRPSWGPATPRPPRRPAPLLLLAFEQQERLKSRRGVHPGATAPDRVSAAKTSASGTL